VVAFAQDHTCDKGHHEPVDQDRDPSSVSSSLTCKIHLVDTRSASLLLPGVPEDQINRTYDVLGPTPRLCLELILDKGLEEQYEDGFNRTVSKVTADQLNILVHEAASLNTDEMADEICLISREDRNDVHRVRQRSLGRGR
jgi:hypothetical protein